MRAPALTILAFIALAACGGETSATDPAETSNGTTAPTDCDPGTEGCACNAGACAAGLACYSEICVMPAAPSSTTTTSDPSTETTDDPSTSGHDTTTSTTDASAETSTSDGGDDSGSDTSDGSGTGALEACAQEGNNFCGDGELHTCTGGVWNVRSCDDECGLSGLGSSGCADLGSCECAGFLDEACSDAAAGYCSCYSLIWGGVCERYDLAVAYDACFDEDSPNHGFIACMAGYPSSTYQECETAWIACSDF